MQLYLKWVVDLGVERLTETENGWSTASGCFWIYYNTRKGKKPANRTKDQELFAKSPWVDHALQEQGVGGL